MKTAKITLILAILLIANSCATKKNTHTATHEEKNEHKHWTYTGETAPKYWSHIKETYFACDGNAQSPINIDTKTAVSSSTNNLELNYNNSNVDVINNGHTEEFLISKGNTLTFNNKVYELKQFHMHTPSEHTVNGKHFPLELHFVNKAKDDTYAVISLLVSEGKESPLLAKYLQNFPKEEGEFANNDMLNITTVLPSTTHFYNYKGSFTTPPCTEAVEWIILKEHITASKMQIEKLHAIMGDNYRPVQALNNRKITVQ